MNAPMNGNAISNHATFRRIYFEKPAYSFGGRAAGRYDARF